MYLSLHPNTTVTFLTDVGSSKTCKMLLLRVVILALVLSYGVSAQIHLRQAKFSVTRAEDKTAHIDCEASGIQNFGNAVIHWYRHRPGEALEWILYFKTQADKSSFDKKFRVDKTTEKSTCTLRVDKLTYNDAATYYCAYWDRTYGVKYFGSGTKLVVSSTPAHLNSTTMQVLPPSTEQDEKVSYMCLIENFHPNVIKVTWEDENKNEEKNGVHEEIWPPGDNQQSYSLSSWLTVDKNSGKNYRCKYEHEIKGDYVPMESPDTTVMPQTTRGCIKFAENDTTLSTDIMESFIHRTAYFIYIVLLLKSTMYYVIVLFFIYRMQSPIKRQGKKPVEGQTMDVFCETSCCRTNISTAPPRTPSAAVLVSLKPAQSRSRRHGGNMPVNAIALTTPVLPWLTSEDSSELLQCWEIFPINSWLVDKPFDTTACTFGRNLSLYTETKLNSNKIQVLTSITEKDGQITHICLIEDFYPNIIKVTWEDDKKNEEKNAVLGEIWPPNDNRQSYSMSSWLTLNKPSNKNYRCNYQHEKEAGFVLTKSQDTTIVPQTTADCTNRLFTVSFMHRTAYVIYIALLLKSTMYYAIVLFFMYRMQSPIKRQGKKP
ncbi:uncharacterized protein LOC127044634 [Gopherus flavomarginatus]|uniref:uncharacterized protein LOC127044634 n=1 Tax=Gopherus flavomarginatus TaxID=286002 RepID=UPI0021CC4C52|nr:uncharacterized protein LOC127044634 [Gopherus flavomarginatus]